PRETGGIWLRRNITLAVCLVGIVLAIFPAFTFIVSAASIITIFSVIAMNFYDTVAALRRGYRPAAFFLASLSIMGIGVMINMLQRLGLIPLNMQTLFLPEITFMPMLVFFSLSIANRLNAMNILLKNLNQNLEKTVAERTQQLNEMIIQQHA